MAIVVFFAGAALTLPLVLAILWLPPTTRAMAARRHRRTPAR